MKKFSVRQFQKMISAGRRDREGIVSFILLLCAAISIHRYFSEAEEITSLTNNEVLFEYLELFPANTPMPEKEAPTDPAINITPFNVDTLSLVDWMSTGLSEKQASVALNYVERSGGIRDIEHLKKIRVLSDRWFERNLQSVRFSSQQESPVDSVRKVVSSEISKVNLNSADTVELENIPGVGAYSARLVWRYRERLGGFHSTEQLREIKKLRPEVLEKILQYSTLDEINVRALCIDTAGVSSLGKHPYLNFKLAKVIVNFRDQRGGIAHIDDLKQCKLVDDSLFLRLRPYLRICND